MFTLLHIITGNYVWKYDSEIRIQQSLFMQKNIKREKWI